MYITRQEPSGFVNWGLAFQLGALVAAIEFVILIPIFKTTLSRLITGVNLFLIVGGIGFYFNINVILEILDQARESALLIAILIVCLLATIKTRSGIFEIQFANEQKQKTFSIYYLIFCSALVIFSYLNKGNTLAAGILPVVSLVVVKYLMGKQLLRLNPQEEKHQTIPE